MHDLKLQILHFKISPVVTAEELVFEIEAIVAELPVKVLISIPNKLNNSMNLCTVYCLSQCALVKIYKCGYLLFCYSFVLFERRSMLWQTNKILLFDNCI